MASWRGNKYSYWLSCTHVTSKIPTIIPKPSSNIERRETTPIAGVGRKFGAGNRNDEKDLPKDPVLAEYENRKRGRSCEEI